MRFSTPFVALAIGGCQLLGGYEEFDYGAPEPTPRHACDVLPTAKEDEQGLAVMARVDLANDTCFWMDRTEVTVEEYERWLEDVPADGIDWEPTWCTWKETRNDPIGDPDNDACVAEMLPFDLQPFAPKKPMRCVDFCEAEAFCRWADKRLCYDVDGLGTQGPRGNPQEWRLTCNNQMTTRYPWGDDQKDVCNTGQDPDACIGTNSTCGPVAVGQKLECTTPRGVVDMLGNVAEWVFSCNFIDPTHPLEPTGCLTLGGGYDEPLTACDVENTVLSDVRQPALGFRCCANLTPDEEVSVGPTRR